MTPRKIPIAILNMEQCLPRILATDAHNTQQHREPQRLLLNDLVPFELSPDVVITVQRDGSLLHNATDYQNLHRRIRWKYSQILIIYDSLASLTDALAQEISQQLDADKRVVPPIPVGDNYWRLTFHYEAYLTTVRSLMDLIAKLTRYAFIGNQPSERSFSKQRKWFIETMPDADPDYRAYLMTRLDWYEDLKKVRDQVTHHSAIEVRIRDSGPGLQIIASTGITRSERDFVDIQELCTTIHCGLQEFLAFFDQHFAGRL